MTATAAARRHPSSRQFGEALRGPADQSAAVVLIRCLPADEVVDPYSARLPSSPFGEKSRRAPVGRGVADEHGVPAPLIAPPLHLLVDARGRSS